MTLVDTSLDIATARVTAISQGTKVDADMIMNVTKTEAVHVCEQGAVSATTAADRIKESV